MAKLKGPLFSLGASGQLAKTLVFFPWKGVQVVRTYVVPANPNTSGQSTQRALMTSAVAAWHAATYLAGDVSAWNRLANLAKGALSGFNRMVKSFIDEEVAGGTWEAMSDVVVTSVTSSGMTVNITKASAGNAPTVHWGVTPTNMPNSNAMSDNTGDDWEYAITGLPSDQVNYFYVDVGSAGVDYGRTGVYAERTS